MPKSKLYEPGQTEPFTISRSRIEEHIRCPRCSVLILRNGIKPPSGPPFTLNSAVDSLLKKEFDQHRAAGTVHPIVAAAGLDLVPFAHHELEKWRYNFTGARAISGDFLVFGAIDDVWADRDGKLYIVDYKATGKKTAVAEVGFDGYHASYRRQLEIYQWLFRQMGFEVSDVAFWLYCSATQKEPSFENVLHFESNLIRFDGSATWIEDMLVTMKADLDAPALPEPGAECEHCAYFVKRLGLGESI